MPNVSTTDRPQGPEGPQGPQGPAGQSSTIAIGTVTTGEPGTEASVTNSGTASAAILDFVIPRGDSATSGGGGNDGTGPVTGTMSQPYVVQHSSLRNDGTLAFLNPPTPGNILLFLGAGYGVTTSRYFPSDFIELNTIYANSNNNTLSGWKRYEDGDPFSWSLNASDNQFCAVFELANVGLINNRATITGDSAIRGGLGGSALSCEVPTTYISPTDLFFATFTQDNTNYPTLDDKDGLYPDIVTTSGGNHGGFIAHYNTDFDGVITGSIGSMSWPIMTIVSVSGQFTPL